MFLPTVDIDSVSSTSLSTSPTSRSRDISIPSSGLENTDSHVPTIYIPSKTLPPLILFSESYAQDCHMDLPLVLENDSDLNSCSRDCIDDRFDFMLTGEELISSDISNVSVTDTPCSLLARNRRIVNTRCIDPLSEASFNYLYNFNEQSCKMVCHS